MSYYATGTGLGQTMSYAGKKMVLPGYKGMSVVKGMRPMAARWPMTVYHGQALGSQKPAMRTGLRGFGQDPSSVCSDWQAGGSGDNAAGDRAARAIQQALNDQGYGPIAVDGQFGSQSIDAWNKFASANPGVASGWPDCNGITRLLGGGGPGGAQAQSGGTTTSSMAFGLAALGLVALGALAYFSKHKKGHETHHAKPREI